MTVIVKAYNHELHMLPQQMLLSREIIEKDPLIPQGIKASPLRNFMCAMGLFLFHRD